MSHPGRPRRLQCAQFEASTSVLVAADNGLAARTPDIDALVAKLRTLPDLVAPETIVNPVEVAGADPALASNVLGDNGRIGLMQVDQDINVEDLTLEDKEQCEDILKEFRVGGLDVQGTGSLMQFSARWH